MKKTPLLFLLFLCLVASSVLNAQDDCEGATSAITFSGNNLEQLTYQGHGLLYEGLGTRFYSSDSTLVNTIFSSALWIGGETPSGIQLLQARTYGAGNGTIGAKPGPLNPEDGQPFPDVCENFDRFWVVSLSELYLFQADLQDNGQLDNDHPAILSWPGRGNPFSLTENGFELPDVPLAPFIDADGDGIYNPEMGDIPQMKGDKMMWWMYNSSGNFPLQYSNRCYAFDDDPEPGVLDKTLYFEMEVTSFLDEPITNTSTALFIDADLGCYTDDFVGCFPEADLAFVYNKDSLDGLEDGSCPQNVSSFQNEIPVLGIKLLESPLSDQGEPLGMTSFIAYVNAGVGSPPPQITDPNNFTEYYNYMSGRWRDGSPLTVGGLGFGGTETTQFAFPGNPSNDEEWSLCSIDGPTLDYRMLLGSGTFQFDPGQTIKLGYAFFLSDGYTLPCPDLSAIVNDCTVVADTYQQLTDADAPVLASANLKVFPNPTTGLCHIRLEKTDDVIRQLSLFDATGRRVMSTEKINQAQMDLDLTHLPKGIYHYKVRTDKGQFAVGKLVLAGR